MVNFGVLPEASIASLAVQAKHISEKVAMENEQVWMGDWDKVVPSRGKPTSILWNPSTAQLLETCPGSPKARSQVELEKRSRETL